jgi:hypothetical protein
MHVHIHMYLKPLKPKDLLMTVVLACRRNLCCYFWAIFSSISSSNSLPSSTVILLGGILQVQLVVVTNLHFKQIRYVFNLLFKVFHLCICNEMDI